MRFPYQEMRPENEDFRQMDGIEVLGGGVTLDALADTHVAVILGFLAHCSTVRSNSCTTT